MQDPGVVKAVTNLVRESLTPMKKSRDGEDQEEGDRKRAAKRPRAGDDVGEDNTPAKPTRQGYSPAPSVACGTASKKSRYRRRILRKTFFSEEEINAVICGMIRFRGESSMRAKIRDYYWVFNDPCNVGRTSFQIKDKARNLKINGVIKTDEDNSKDNISQHDDTEEPDLTEEATERIRRVVNSL